MLNIQKTGAMIFVDIQILDWGGGMGREREEDEEKTFKEIEEAR